MTIDFEGKYKSLNSFKSETLNKFTVITGKNGCGKSQLIELLDIRVKNDRYEDLKIELTPNPNIFQIEGLENRGLSTINTQYWGDRLKIYVDNFIVLSKNTKLLIEILLKANTWSNEIHSDYIFETITEDVIEKEKLKSLIIDNLKEREADFFDKNPKFEDVVHQLFHGHHFIRKEYAKAAKHVANFRHKKLEEITKYDFYQVPLESHFIDDPDLFYSRLETIFYCYAKNRDLNRRLFFDKINDGIINNSISDEEFAKKNTPPWDIVNEIIKNHNLNFKLSGINKEDFSPEATVNFNLIKTTTNDVIQFENLSSGEKVILGLIIKLFTSNYYQNELRYPDLIILDEPDAHLHPEMSKLLIDVLKNTFVNKLGIHVLMTTHSPSTVALCPDESIYQLTNEPTTSLKHIEKEDALNILTGHLPTLSIDYKNHKQVFVESPTDIKYYQTIFDKLHQQNNYPFKLYFISNSYGKSNCSQVIKIVNDIRESGNKTSYGIIDWDLDNNSTKYVKVHGENNRYNVENYLYDPIYLSILLMNLNAHNVFKELGLNETINEYSIGNESEELLQMIIDWFFMKYYEKHSVEQNLKDNLKKIEYKNGKKLKIPKWYLEFSGHDLEDRIKSVFPAISKKYTGEGALQKELSLIIGKCFPFIPKDSEILIEEIINNN